MTVDMNKAVVGSTVHFATGGNAVVTEAWDSESGRLHLGGGYLPTFYETGTNIHSSAFNIVRIDPPVVVDAVEECLLKHNICQSKPFYHDLANAIIAKCKATS